jgi:hypothetical protein
MPGEIRQLTREEYDAEPRQNVTSLTGLEESAQQFEHDRSNPSERSDAMRVSSAAHVRTLEPDRFSEYPVLGQCTATVQPRSGTPHQCKNQALGFFAGQQLCGVHDRDGHCDRPADYVTEKELQEIDAWRDALFTHPVSGLLARSGGCEVSILWSIDDLLMKSRLDKLTSDNRTIIDLKFLRKGHGHPRRFSQLVGEYMGVQAAAYTLAVEAVHGVRPAFVWVVCEKSPPHVIATYEATEAVIEAGENELRWCVQRYKACRDRDEWPGYTTDVTPLDGPPWWYKKWGIE